MHDYVRTAKDVVGELFGRDRSGVAVRFWDGTELDNAGAAPFRLLVNEPAALRAAFRPPVDLNAGRAFAAGLLDIEGDVEAAVDALMQRMRTAGAMQMMRLALLLRKLPKPSLPRLREARLHGKRHTIARDREAIGFHYDQPVAFYRAFLDPLMVYSCAYFDDGVTGLADAQLAKIDYTLHKLRLRPGERLLDIGCGWGALVVRAAQAFGAKVTGVTLSQKQFEEGQRRIAEAGLQDSASIELRDYRELQADSFDKIVSVGMFEHVGRSRMADYFGTAFRLLQPAGLFLNHAIANEMKGDGKASGFMDAFIFPDGELLHISEALGGAEAAGFEVRDVENLREHYHRTLRAWVANLERNRDAAVAAAGEQSYRAWRLYMAGSAQGFHSGRMGLYQSLLAKPADGGRVDIPATRRDLYTQHSVRAS